MPASNIETRDHIWLAYSWPKELQFLDALEIPPENQFVESYQAVPRTYAGQLAWAYVARNRREKDHTRGLMLLYKNPPTFPNSPSEVLCPVGIRVQGFIERCNLKPLGSWESGKHPEYAIQHVVLSGGKEHEDIFRHYQQAVDEIVKFIYRALGVPEPSREQSNSLFIGRRVFTKVNASNRRQPSALEAGDDPLGFCREIDAEWRVMKKVSVGMYVEEVEESEHFKVPCDAMIFTEGDFVDVCIGFDIVSKRGRDGWMNVQVHLNIEHILLLVAGPDVGIEEDDDGEFAVQAPGLVF